MPESEEHIKTTKDS